MPTGTENEESGGASGRVEMRVEWLGRREYREVWDLQRERAAQRLAGEIPDTLLLLEHPSTLTLGRAADRGHIVAAAERLEREAVAVVESDRGGDVTYHGPGQLVGYPIFNLRDAPHRPDLHRYVRNIEETMIHTVAAFGIEAGRFPGYPGVWTGLDTPHPTKIAALGIRLSRWITHHGFALNVQTDLSYFDLIVPCGIHDYGVTSLSRILERTVSLAEVLPVVIQAFTEVFALTVENPQADWSDSLPGTG
ncbi:MAG: lipoate-protein ligase [Chthonomonadales bacterium]|nr:lipoate-protein ligase [Chthonomonadales bacterium]